MREKQFIFTIAGILMVGVLYQGRKSGIPGPTTNRP